MPAGHLAPGGDTHWCHEFCWDPALAAFSGGRRTPHLTAEGKLRLGGPPGWVPSPRGVSAAMRHRPARDSPGRVTGPRPAGSYWAVLGRTGRAAPGAAGGRGERHAGAPMGPPAPGAGEQPLPPPVPAWPPWSPWAPGALCRWPPGYEVRTPPRPWLPPTGRGPCCWVWGGGLGWIVPCLGMWVAWHGWGVGSPFLSFTPCPWGGGQSQRVVGWGSSHPCPLG